MITGGEGLAVLVFFSFAAFDVADLFAGSRLAAGFWVSGFGFDFLGATDSASLGVALNDFTALGCFGSGAIVFVVGDAGL